MHRTVADQFSQAHAPGGQSAAEPDKPSGLVMTGLIAFSSGYHATRECDALLMLGMGFPHPQLCPEHARVAQVDLRPELIGRRTVVEPGVVGDARKTLKCLVPRPLPGDAGLPSRWR